MGRTTPDLGLDAFYKDQYFTEYRIQGGSRLFTCKYEMTLKNAQIYFGVCEYTFIAVESKFFANVDLATDYRYCCQFMQGRVRGNTSSRIFMNYSEDDFVGIT